MKSYKTTKNTVSGEIGFELDGEQFICFDRPPTTAWEILQSSQIGIAHAMSFIRSCIATEELVEKFNAIVHQRGVLISEDVLEEIAIDLVQSYTNRPLAQSSSSGGGLGQETPTSMGSSSSQASTERKLTSIDT